MKPSKILSDKDLEKVVSDIFSELQDVCGVINITQIEMTNSIYDRVLSRLKENKWFYKDLSDEKLQRIRRIMETDYKYKKSLDPDEEYDNLVWKKINDEPYDKKRLEELKRILKVHENV